MFPLRVALILFSSLLLLGCANTTQKPNNSAAEVQLENSQIFEIFSPSLKQNYRIRVRLPGNYHTNPQQDYPIILKVDGQWDFLLASNVVNCLYFDGQMPEAIVVGVDWGEVKGDIQAVRAIDLLPSPIAHYPESGGAKDFTNALAEEIIPQLENKFRSNGKRYLLGGSWGGLYVTYALLERPDIFDGAVAIAGDYALAQEKLSQMITMHKGSNNLQNKRLYLGVGELDRTFPAVKGLVKELTQANIDGFQIMYESKPGYGHSGMNVPGYASGFKFMFQREALELPQEVLQSYAGRWQSTINPEEIYTVTAANNRLEVEGPHNLHYTLIAEAQNQFYHPGMLLNIRFDNDQAFATTFYGENQFKRMEN